MSKEAMKLALEALEHCKDVIVERGLNGSPEFAKKWGLTLPLERSEKAITALREALAQQPAQQEPVNGCVCRWDAEGDRVITCERHQGWLEVIAEWVDRARDAEKKLKALDTSPPAQRKPLTVWTEAQHERAYRNSPELHKDVKSLAAFKRVAKEIAAMYGIKENT